MTHHLKLLGKEAKMKRKQTKANGSMCRAICGDSCYADKNECLCFKSVQKEEPATVVVNILPKGKSYVV